MTIKKLAKELSKREGLKKQVDIAQITELLGHLSDILLESSNNLSVSIVAVLYQNGIKRRKKRKKKCE